MKTSIIIPNWNGKNLLEKNLPSALKAGADEIIVVDDGSTDGSYEFVASHFPETKLIKHTTNEGFGKSVNDGVKEATGEIVILLNTDVAPYGNIVKPILPHFQDKLVFGVSLAEVGYYWSRPKIENGFVGHTPGEKTNKPHSTFWISGGSGAFRKSMWQELNGMDSLYKPFYWEDVDLSFMALKHGWKLIWEPKAKVVHKHESTINTINFNKKYMDYIKERNLLIFHWKNLNLSWLLTHHVMGILRRLRNPGYIIIVFLALLKLPRIFLQRIGRKDKLTDEEIFRKFS